MGMDIIMNIHRGKELIAKDIFPGRDSEWFNNIMGRGSAEEYYDFPRRYGIPDEVPDFIKEAEAEEGAGSGDFNFQYVKVGDFMEWFRRVRPDTYAGWVTTYDKWLYETRGIDPDDACYRYLPEDARIEDMHFMEFVKKYDSNSWLYTYLVENNIAADATITYWFNW